MELENKIIKKVVPEMVYIYNEDAQQIGKFRYATKKDIIDGQVIFYICEFDDTLSLHVVEGYIDKQNLFFADGCSYQLEEGNKRKNWLIALSGS